MSCREIGCGVRIVQSMDVSKKNSAYDSTTIAFYIYYLLIISPGIYVYVYYMVFAKLLQENYLNNLFRTFPYGNIMC